MGHRRHAGERRNGALLREEPEALVFAERAGSCGESDRYVAGIVTLFEPRRGYRSARQVLSNLYKKL
jgi:hypothetical protein